MLQAAVASIFVHATSKPAKPATVQTGFLLREGESRLPNLRCMLSTQQTHGTLLIGHPPDRSCKPTPQGAVPLHVHPHQDEWWYVTEGEFLFQVGNEKFHARAGDSVWGPRGVPHSFRTLGEITSMFTIWQPAGMMEDFFIRLEALWAKLGSPPPPEQFAALFRDHDMEMLGPPVQA